jgi:hypothetical protein
LTVMMSARMPTIDGPDDADTSCRDEESGEEEPLLGQ